MNWNQISWNQWRFNNYCREPVVGFPERKLEGRCGSNKTFIYTNRLYTLESHCWYCFAESASGWNIPRFLNSKSEMSYHRGLKNVKTKSFCFDNEKILIITSYSISLFLETVTFKMEYIFKKCLFISLPPTWKK